jgi:hypothetical protein
VCGCARGCGWVWAGVGGCVWGGGGRLGGRAKHANGEGDSFGLNIGLSLQDHFDALRTVGGACTESLINVRTPLPFFSFLLLTFLDFLFSPL